MQYIDKLIPEYLPVVKPVKIALKLIEKVCSVHHFKNTPNYINVDGEAVRYQIHSNDQFNIIYSEYSGVGVSFGLNNCIHQITLRVKLDDEKVFFLNFFPGETSLSGVANDHYTLIIRSDLLDITGESHSITVDLDDSEDDEFSAQLFGVINQYYLLMFLYSNLYKKYINGADLKFNFKPGV